MTSRVFCFWTFCITAILVANMASLYGSCPSGALCSCANVQADTCGGGWPPSCDACRGLFMPCWDKYCVYTSDRCSSDPSGSSNCVETLISMVNGQQRQCISGTIDWSTCWGQPTCVTFAFNNNAGNRYSCSAGGS